MGSEKRGWLRGAFLLTIAGLISKVLSAGYRVPLQNLTGDVGFYVYQQVYPLLGMALVLSLYGFPSAVSKITADANKKSLAITWKNFYLPLFFILFILISIVSVLLFTFSEHLAQWVGDTGLTTAYRLIALSLFTIPFTSLLRGVFQGNQQMKPTAYSQVGEQLIRVLIIIAVAIYVSISGESLYRIGEGAVFASLFGGLAAIIVLIFFIRKKDHGIQPISVVPWRYYVQTILVLGLVASLNHMVLLLFQFADAFTLIPALQEYGLQLREAMEAKGVLDRGQPLIQHGTVLGSSFALAMIPTISKERLQEIDSHLYIQSSMKVSFYLAVGATAGLVAIMPEANILLFEDTNGTNELRILVLAILLSSLGITCATILQGLGMMKRTAIFILLAVVIKWFGNELLVPIIGITGSAVATNLGLSVFLIFVLVEIKRKLPELKLVRSIHWPTLLLATLAMLFYILMIDLLVPNDLSRIGALVYVIFVASTGAIIYIFILLRGKAFISREIKLLPFGHLFMRIHKERDK